MREKLLFMCEERVFIRVLWLLRLSRALETQAGLLLRACALEAIPSSYYELSFDARDVYCDSYNVIRKRKIA